MVSEMVSSDSLQMILRASATLFSYLTGVDRCVVLLEVDRGDLWVVLDDISGNRSNGLYKLVE